MVEKLTIQFPAPVDLIIKVSLLVIQNFNNLELATFQVKKRWANFERGTLRSKKKLPTSFLSVESRTRKEFTRGTSTVRLTLISDYVESPFLAFCSVWVDRFVQITAADHGWVERKTKGVGSRLIDRAHPTPNIHPLLRDTQSVCVGNLTRMACEKGASGLRAAVVHRYSADWRYFRWLVRRSRISDSLTTSFWSTSRIRSCRKKEERRIKDAVRNEPWPNYVRAREGEREKTRSLVRDVSLRVKLAENARDAQPLRRSQYA